MRFSVSDTGPGIPVAEQTRIFLPFQRGRAGRQGGADGVGVGLAIARQLVRLMGGELELNSRPGQGSTFAFEIPALPAAPPVRAPSCARRAPRPYRLLVVDDDDAVRQMAVHIPCDYRAVRAIPDPSTLPAAYDPGTVPSDFAKAHSLKPFRIDPVSLEVALGPDPIGELLAGKRPLGLA